MMRKIFFLLSLTLLIACSRQDANLQPTKGISSTSTSLAPTPTILPTATTPIEVSCTDLDTAWGNGDWLVTLDILAELKTAVSRCGPTLVAEKQYAAHINYGITLENEDKTEQAIIQFQAAYQINVHGPEAVAGLLRNSAQPIHDCQPTEPLSPYQPTKENSTFLQIQGNSFSRNNETFQMKGVNYYPRFAPWSYFWQESNLSDVEEEFQLLATAGLNTIRIFLHHNYFFTCRAEDSVPVATSFDKLDNLIHLAAKYNLGLILTLNDLPDLTFRPLYTKPQSKTETEFIVRRYQHEPMILAWDLRNEGDIDYGAHPAIEGHVSRDTVLAWLSEIATIVKQNDPNHLITAGWWGDPTETAEFVDFVSFHHWGNADELVPRITQYHTKTNKPILLQEVGYPAQGEEGETYQATMFPPILTTVQNENLAGWIAWTAFDFAPYDDPFANQEKFFGLWQYDLTPKAFIKTATLNE